MHSAWLSCWLHRGHAFTYRSLHISGHMRQPLDKPLYRRILLPTVLRWGCCAYLYAYLYALAFALTHARGVLRVSSSFSSSGLRRRSGKAAPKARI